MPSPTGPRTLTGVVTEGWSGQSASLRLEAVTFSDAIVLTEAPIGADGSFTVTLPDPQELADRLTPVEADALCALYEPDPATPPEVTPASLEALYAEARVYSSTAAEAEPVGVLGYQADTAAGLASVVQVYAASAGTVEGSCGDGALTFDLELVAGWNEVLHTESGGDTTLTAGSLPGGLRWRYYATSGEAGPPLEPPTPTTPIPREISGTAAVWSGGGAVVRAESFGLDSARVDVADGTISADGRFSVTLPVDGAALADALLTADADLFCPGPNSVSTVEITPGPFETVLVLNLFRVYDAADSRESVGIIFPDYSVLDDSPNYFYAASEVSVAGACVTTYGEESSTTRFDLDFKAGWNAVFSTESGPGSEAVLSVSTGPFPTNIKWIYEDEAALPEPPEPPTPPCANPECAPPDTPGRRF